MAERQHALPRQARNNGMALRGRPIRVPRGKATVRQILRQHLREEGHRMQELAGPWKCKPQTVYDMFYDGRAFSPAHIDAAAAFLRLDEHDTAELRILGAREAGWNIDPQYLLQENQHG
ncbi:hypothetical protein [Xanthomonas sp. NCPPB 1128]|uniref:hypothetical protein n=1 Tax=Xanthomonas sp. NCPPB 1128 TaxID=1775876 RepID=UPI001D17B79A|nr:hypothetical protein [Xanthomonas sp. NCPPB 1128]